MVQQNMEAPLKISSQNSQIVKAVTQHFIIIISPICNKLVPNCNNNHCPE